ncbi:MtrB/PioB family outer membrane beta-barrel protein, partial [Kaarinaea lacus]
MQRSLLVFLLVALSYAIPVSAQPLGSDADTTQWQCKWCPTAKQGKVDADLKAGLGYVTNDSYKFGDYTGLNEKGAYILADAEVKSRGKGGEYFNLQADDLGLDSRHISMEAGHQGSAQFEISYDQLPKLNVDTARTPYSGESVQRLPTGWVPASTTSGMTELANSLRDINLSTERRKATIGATYFQTAALSYDVLYQRETKKGNKSAGLAFGGSFASAKSAILAIPVDYETDMAKFGVNYRARRWQLAANYQFSAFNNRADSIVWDNAFNTPTNTPDTPEGQAALEPDNSMQQLSANASFNITDSIVLSGLLSYGQMRQDQQFLPYTINSNVTSQSLPRDSLDGKINTFDGSVNLHAGITEKLYLQFQINHHEQDNTTSRSAYRYVIADTFEV